MLAYYYCCLFGQSVLRKIFKFIATRWHLLRLICTKFDVGWGSDPDQAGVAALPPDLLAGFKGTTSKGREGKGERKGDLGSSEQCLILNTAT